MVDRNSSPEAGDVGGDAIVTKKDGSKLIIDRDTGDVKEEFTPEGKRVVRVSVTRKVSESSSGKRSVSSVEAAPVTEQKEVLIQTRTQRYKDAVDAIRDERESDLRYKEQVASSTSPTLVNEERILREREEKRAFDEEEADIIWMSPPCTTFSLASGNTHWTADRQPKTENAKIGRELLEVCQTIAERCEKNGQIFFIENPNGRAVWFLPNKWLKRVWYCQYGDSRAKPTNIWTNLDIDFKTCKNYNSKQVSGLEEKHCHHEQARRGAKTGTQGLKGNMERSIIPPQLFVEILDHIKELS